ncbi:MAG: GAF domain-containing protein [Acidobacteriota bacterium]
MRDETEVIEQVRRAFDGTGDRREKYTRVAEALRKAGGYRWVGIYDAGEKEIVLLAWSGDAAPAHPKFPLSHGLCGEAARTRQTVIVGDVASDPRYFEAFASTRSEIVVPVIDAVTGRARALIDVESDRLDAFGDEDRAFLQRAASAISSAVSASPG